jgi:hypothetical protein
MPLGVPTNITQTGNGQNLYLLETDAGGGGAGVVQLVAGTGVTLSPPSGEGIVTINATAPPAPVTRLLAGTNVTLSPTSGLGEVTINASGGGGGAVSSVAGVGAGINVTPTTGAVVVSNTGVTSIVAGDNVTVSGATGAVTVNAQLSLATSIPAINIQPVAGNFVDITGAVSTPTAIEIPIADAQKGWFAVIFSASNSFTDSTGRTRAVSAIIKIAKSGIYATQYPEFLGGIQNGSPFDGSASGFASVNYWFGDGGDPNFWYYVINASCMTQQPRSTGQSNISLNILRFTLR